MAPAARPKAKCVPREPFHAACTEWAGWISDPSVFRWWTYTRSIASAALTRVLKRAPSASSAPSGRSSSGKSTRS